MGQKFSCNVHQNTYKFYCENCSQYICEKCITSHPCHNIHHIDSISFDMSSNISKVVSEIELEIHKAQQSSHNEDLSSYFSKCSNSIQFLISELSSLGNVLESLQNKIKETIGLLNKKIQDNIEHQKIRKNELTELNSHLSEIAEKKDYKGLANCLMKCKDQLSIENFKKITNTINSQRKHMSNIIKDSITQLVDITDSISKFSNEFITSEKFYFKRIEDVINETKNEEKVKAFEASIENLAKNKSLGKIHFSPQIRKLKKEEQINQLQEDDQIKEQLNLLEPFPKYEEPLHTKRKSFDKAPLVGNTKTKVGKVKRILNLK